MLSIHTLGSPEQATNYYETGDYYSQDKTNVNEWYGDGAKELDLTGKVDFDQFKQVLAGEMPNGVKMLSSFDKHGNTKRRTGYDLTFSAPKSLSVLALVAGDRRLIAAHQQAVRTTLHYIEQNILVTRIKRQGKIKVTPTKNIVASMHLHNTSRELDPNLHTHCVIVNATKIDDKWRAIFCDPLYNQKMDLGFYYRNELVSLIRKLGYEINLTGKNGLFEIQGVSLDLLRLFSKRRIQIESMLERMQASSARASETANLLTRVDKKITTFAQAKEHWQQELTNGSTLEDLENFIARAKLRGPIAIAPMNILASRAIDQAITAQSENKAVFSIPNVLKKAKFYSPGADIPVKYLMESLDEKITNKDVIRLGNNCLTTRATIIATKDLTNIVQVRNKSFWQIDASPFGVGTKLVGLTSRDFEQLATIKQLLTSKAQFSIIETTELTAQKQLFAKFYTIITGNAFIHNLHPNKKLAADFTEKPI